MELEKFGVVEMTAQEQKDENGGFLGPVASAFGVIGALAFAAGYLYEKYNQSQSN